MRARAHTHTHTHMYVYSHSDETHAGMLPDPAGLKHVLGAEDHAPMPFSFGSKIDLGGSKACVRLGKPFQRFSSRENCAVACEWSHPFSIDTVGSTIGVELAGDGFVIDTALQVNI